MKRRKGHIIFTVLLTFSLSSCNDFLEVSPDLRTDLNSVEKVGELLATAYPQANYITFTETISDNVGDKGEGSVPVINTAPYFFEDVADIYQDSPTYYWNAAYSAIAAANHALEAIDAAGNTTEYQPYRGEALLARAYAHFMLVNLFAHIYEPYSAGQWPGIPYVKEVGKTVIQKYERHTVQYVYEQIEQDLLEGLPLLDDRVYTVPKYHFTRVAANAFASRFYLFKQDYEKAVEHANLALGTGDVTNKLRPINSEHYRSLQYYELQAQYTQADNQANLLLVETSSLWGRSYAGYRYGFDYNILNELFYGENVTGGYWAYNIYGTELYLNIPKFREHFVRGSLHAETGIPYNMIPLLTNEEVLFNRAEANAMLGNLDDAIADLNTYASTRIIYSSTTPVYSAEIHNISRDKLLSFYNSYDLRQAIVDCVLDFKRVNFIHEGMRWFDLIRHKIGVVHRTADNRTLTLGPNDPMRLFQIPQEAQSSGIELNPR